MNIMERQKPNHEFNDALMDEVAGKPGIKGIGCEGKEIELTASQWQTLHNWDLWFEVQIPWMEKERREMHRMPKDNIGYKNLDREPRKG